MSKKNEAPQENEASGSASDAPQPDLEVESSDQASDSSIETDSIDNAESEEGGEEPDELAVAQAAAAENYDKFVRARADLDNAVKRHQRDISDRVKYGAERLARDLLPVVDDLERALEHAGSDSEGIVSGVELVLKSLNDTMQNHGIQRIEALGEVFDPTLHEAVAMVETADAEPNTVFQVHRTGYVLHDRLLRASMVVVAKALPGQSAASDDDSASATN